MESKGESGQSIAEDWRPQKRPRQNTFRPRPSSISNESACISSPSTRYPNRTSVQAHPTDRCHVTQTAASTAPSDAAAIAVRSITLRSKGRLGVLQPYSLIQWRDEQGGYAMHTQVHAWGQDRLDVGQQRHLSVMALESNQRRRYRVFDVGIST